jgi:hypothetical protein
MSDDIVMKVLTEKYFPLLDKLYQEDIEKFKKLYKDTSENFENAIKLTNGQPTQDIVNRKIFLDIMSAVNAIHVVNQWVDTSKDNICKFLRGDEVSAVDLFGIEVFKR